MLTNTVCNYFGKLSRIYVFDNNINSGWDYRFSVLKILDLLKEVYSAILLLSSFNNIWKNTFITNLHLTT